MLQITILLSVAALWTFAVVSPGPNFLVTARLSMARSRRAGLQAVCGITFGVRTAPALGTRFENQQRLIAVGTPVTERPPHRSVRAELPHTAPTSGI